MPRIISDDFKELCKFIENYRISDVVADKEAKELLSACHKKYYAFLILIEVMREFVDNHKLDPELSSQQFKFMQEACSDMGQAFFLTINGCYKGAKLLLRSSIENFLKGTCMDEILDIISTKSVYEVFDIALTTTVFAAEKKELHDRLHDIYGLLCQDVHTASEKNMASITALNHFPIFVKEECSEVQRHVQTLVNIYITCIALKYNELYHKIDIINKEVLNKEVIKKYKKTVQNIA